MTGIKIIPCSGAEYNGELARQVAIRLYEKGPIAHHSSMLCFTIFLRTLLSNPQRAPEIIKTQLSSSPVIVIEGCNGSCVLKILKILNSADFKPDLQINVEKLVPKKIIDHKNGSSIENPFRISNIKNEDIEIVSSSIVEQLKDKGIIKADIH